MGPAPSSTHRVRHRLAVALILAALAVTSTRATTLAIVRTPNEIVIAADSRMTLYGTRPQQACKIRRQGDVVFAMAGIIERSEGGPEVHDEIANVLRRPVSWTEQIRTIEQRLQDPLLRTLRRMRRELPDEFLEQLRRQFALHVSVAAFRNGSAVLEMREFFVELAPDGSLRLRINRISCPAQCAGPTEVIGVGETDAMMRRVNGLRRFPADLASLAHDLVGLQIRETPEFVGPPIDVIRVNRTGVEWVTRKPSCPA